MNRKIVAIALSVALTFQMVSGLVWIPQISVAGADTITVKTMEPTLKNGVYQLSNVNELLWARENPDKDYELMNDIDLSQEKNWTGVGTETKPYTGDFNGNGHTIKLEINSINSSSGIYSVGLFGYVTGKISNLTVTGTVTAKEYSGYVGGIAAVLAGGTISHCTSNVNITATTDTGVLNVGGVAGAVRNQNQASVIEYVVNHGSLTVNAVSAANGENDVNNGTSGSTGGIVGLIAAKCGAEITRTVNNGAITVIGGKNNIGGIVGQTSVNENSTYANITYCANKGNITGYKIEGERAAGIIGYIKSGKIEYCYNTGNVIEYSDVGNTVARSGYGNYFGIFGYANLSSSNKLSVIYCYNASSNPLEAEICVVRNPEHGTFKNFYISGRSEYETELNSNAKAGSAGASFGSASDLYTKITDTTQGASAYRQNKEGGYPVLYFEENAFSNTNISDNDSVSLPLSDMPKYIDGTVSANTYNCGPGMASDQNGTTSEDAKMVVVSSTSKESFEKYVDKLICRGFEKQSKTILENNIHYTLTKSEKIYYIYYTESKKETRIIEDNSSNVLLSNISSKATGSGNTELYMYSIDYTKGESTTSVTDYWQIDCGMMFMIKLADNSLFLIDSGHERQSSKEAMEAQLAFMRKITNTSENEKVKIRGWFFSHAHGDHVFGAHQFVSAYHDSLQIDSVLFNFPGYGVVGGYDGGTFKMKDTINKYFPNVKHVSLHTGQQFIMQGVQFDTLCTHEDWVGADGKTTLGGDMNTASTVLKITIDGKSLMLLGDITKSNQLENMYTTTLKSDMVQVAHHGYNRLTSLYKAIAAKYAICPNSEENAGLNSGNKQKLQDILDAGASTAIFSGDYTYKLTMSGSGVEMKTYDNYRKSLGIDFNIPSSSINEVSGKSAVIGTNDDISKGRNLRDKVITVSVNGSPVTAKHAGNAIRTENAYCVFDGNTGTKFCTETIPAHIKWKMKEPVIIDEYVLYTGNDTQGNPGRNPVKWILKGSMDGKNWTTIDAVSDGNLPAENKKATIFKTKNPAKYQYFAMQFFETASGSIMQLSEIELIENQRVTVSDKLDVQGFQVSHILKGIRTVSSVESEIDGKKVVEFGNVYGLLTSNISVNDLLIGSENVNVKYHAATKQGIIEENYSSSPTATNYVLTMTNNGTTKDAYNQEYLVRAYAKLADGSYVYSKVYKYSIFKVAKSLYNDKAMSTFAGHLYLYNDILKIVDSEFKEVDYNWSNIVAH